MPTCDNCGAYRTDPCEAHWCVLRPEREEMNLSFTDVEKGTAGKWNCSICNQGIETQLGGREIEIWAGDTQLRAHGGCLFEAVEGAVKGDRRAPTADLERRVAALEKVLADGQLALNNVLSHTHLRGAKPLAEPLAPDYMTKRGG